MYSWGDDTSTWKNAGSYDYGSGQRDYLDKLAKKAAAKGPRTYVARSAPDLKLVDPERKTIRSESENPVIIGIDSTGSMQHWPAEIFDRSPLVYQTLSKYRPDVEVSFSVIGDGFTDSYPLQVADFDKGPNLDDKLKALYPEGGGGGQGMESYEMWAYFMEKHCETPKATKPFMILMGDEGFYREVNPGMVKRFIGDKLTESGDAKAVWKALGKRFNIYLLHKPYEDDMADKNIVAQWSEALGKEKVIPVYDATRVVDVALGIVARHWGSFDDFTKSLGARQDAAGIETVMKSLHKVKPKEQ